MNNPPAFPDGKGTKGMTLRDYFAAQAIQGLLSSTVNAPLDVFVKQAYKVADSMLKARETDGL